MRKMILIVILLLCIHLFGNAEPIDILSSLKSSGNFVTLEKSEIVIKKERLKIVVDNVWASFDINYLYHNKGKDDVVYLAFPVDFIVGLFDAKQNPTEHDMEIFHIKRNGKPLIYDYVMEEKYCCDTGSCDHSKTKAFNTTSCDGKMFRRWYVTKVIFPSKKTTEISIKYKVHSWGSPRLYSGHSVPEMTNRVLTYDFFPAKYFGAGKAELMEIILDVRQLSMIEGSLKSILPTSLLKKKEKGIYQYKGVNFDFSKYKSLSLEYDVKGWELWDYLQNYQSQNYHSNIHRTMVSSSSMEKYGVKNLFDGNPKTAWCFNRKKDANPWIELTLFTSNHISMISLLNGYLKDKEVYEKNGFVTKVHIETDCLGGRDGNRMVRDESVTINKPKWKKVFTINPNSANKIVWDASDKIRYNKESFYLHRTCKIKIFIDKSIKGNKSDDVCISEIFLM
ncbi:hypothetical protein KAH37_02360 [bacterium]|nr:hypothetical protein [bacterium]